jgi:hypothetical protein
LATEVITQETAISDMPATSRSEKPQDRKTEPSGMPNWTIRFPRKQQQHLVASKRRRHPMGLLLISREAFRGRQARGAKLWPMMKQSLTQREV